MTVVPASPAPPGPVQRPAPGYDEAFVARGRPRAQYADALGALRDEDLGRLRGAVAESLASAGVSFGEAGGPFVVDPVPRILTTAEWDVVKAGVAQRIRALDAFTADAYGERRMVSAGKLPARVIEGAEGYEPALRGWEPPGGTWIHVAGLDLIRNPDGGFAVLEDNCRTPSGVAYATAARDALERHFPGGVPDDVRPLDGAWEHLASALRACAPGGESDPEVVLLCDGPDNVAFYEHRAIARQLGIPLVMLEDLHVRDERLMARTPDGELAVDVVYRRTNEDRFEADGALTPVATALEGPMRAGSLAVANAFGTGVADDKLTHAYVEDMIRFYLGEEPLLPSVPTYDLGDPSVRERALERIAELVIKPRWGHGGRGIVVCPHARPEDVAAIAEAVRATPEDYVAQELVMLSTHPTVCGDALAPRHVDLRPFAYVAGSEVRVVPGGLTRVALAEGALVVNSSQDGGGKDTWVMAR